MEPEGRRLVSLQLFLPVRDRLFASSLAEECPPKCRDYLSDWHWLWIAKTQLWSLREFPFPFFLGTRVLQGGILRILTWHQAAGGIWSQAPGFGRTLLSRSAWALPGLAEVCKWFPLVWKAGGAIQTFLLQPWEVPSSILGPGRSLSQAVGEVLVYQPLPFELTFCPRTHTRCAWGFCPLSPQCSPPRAPLLHPALSPLGCASSHSPLRLFLHFSSHYQFEEQVRKDTRWLHSLFINPLRNREMCF